MPARIKILSHTFPPPPATFPRGTFTHVEIFSVDRGRGPETRVALHFHDATPYPPAPWQTCHGPNYGAAETGDPAQVAKLTEEIRRAKYDAAAEAGMNARCPPPDEDTHQNQITANVF